jgi:hypothetical protein
MSYWLLWLLCFCTTVGVNLDMCGVLLGEGFLCLLWGPVWVRFSPQMLGQLGCSLLAPLSALCSCIAHLGHVMLLAAG